MGLHLAGASIAKGASHAPRLKRRQVGQRLGFEEK